ncbi:MAG: membrane-associated protease 1 [Halanaerobacter sp.]
MGFRLTIEGQSETIKLGMENINDVSYRSDTPNDSNARATDLSTILTVSGKILAAVDGEPDQTKKLSLWSLVSAEKSDAYRNAVLEVIAGDQVVRKVTFPNSFVVDYTEDFGHTEGVGTFVLVLKQKKDKLPAVAIDGNYAK